MVAQHFWRCCWLTACLHKVNLVCTHLRLKVQRCLSLFKMPSYRTVNVFLRQNNKTITQNMDSSFMRVTLSHMISGNVAFNFASIVSSIAITLVPYLKKFTDYTKTIGQMALEYLLPLWYPLTLVHTDKPQVSSDTWWQVLLCLWLCCMVLAAVC